MLLRFTYYIFNMESCCISDNIFLVLQEPSPLPLLYPLKVSISMPEKSCGRDDKQTSGFGTAYHASERDAYEGATRH